MFLTFFNFFLMNTSEQHEEQEYPFNLTYFSYFLPVSSDHTDFITEYNKMELRN